MYSLMTGNNYYETDTNSFDNYFYYNEDFQANMNNDWSYMGDVGTTYMPKSLKPDNIPEWITHVEHMNLLNENLTNDKPSYVDNNGTSAIRTWQGKAMEDWTNDEVLDFIMSELLLECYETSPERSQRFRCISGYIFQQLTEEHCKELSGSKDVGELIYRAKSLYLAQQVGNRLETCANHWTTENNCMIPYPVKIENEGIPGRRPGRPRSVNTVRRKSQKRSEKLWEFIINLLKNSKTCPDLIKWEDFEEGTFKFVQSEKVAQLWGARKKNGNMNYEKFSRALRYYYKSKILQAVPGKRLVYKFGPQAKGWRIASPLY
ncbi:hypothetical protein HHI36_011531 [Cryptolaemus montrouzieri]|uniref:ETS domain-containing protein n=1 Tax=Cryptolaemus montrouzieri TaxID=559131 RepID=A0ABD2MM87_9CUCU